MKGLAVQVLAAVLLFVSLSFSQEDGEKRPKYVVVDKQINVREIIRFGGRRGEGQNDVEEFEAPEETGSSHEASVYSLFSMLSNAAKIRKIKNMLPLSGLQVLPVTDDDTGTAINCGPSGSHINVTWKPKVIDPQKYVQIYLDIVDPIDFDKGKAHIDVYMEDSPQPIFSVDQDISCTDIQKAVGKLFSCPIKKGGHQGLSFQYKDLTKLPTGSYTIVLKIFSYATNPNPLFACLNVTLKIVPSMKQAAHPLPQVIV
ncbi:uncharacterized protein LOC133172044 [Saccostrea echinata]|uniref:uncharacterized protein LOC133172044 n=1 Tax=Saccostrea echinata TaxID=191078 RepID=UPI002A8093D0|nr:uncharacterized protein LOC133172044 [Saccostrea echinata]